MFQFLTSFFGQSDPLEAIPLTEEPDAPIPARRPKVIDINGLFQQASLKVPFGRLLRMKREGIQLVSREKLQTLINQAVKNIVDRYRIVDLSSHPIPPDRIETETREEFDSLLAQYLRSAQDAGTPAIPFQVVEGNPGPELDFAKIQLKPGRGLHLGTVNLVAAARAACGGDFLYTQQRNTFLEVLADPTTKKLMNQLGLGHISQGDQGYIVGNAAVVLGRMFGKKPRRPMKDGTLSADEPLGLFILSLLVKQLLGYPRQEGEICVYSVPADPVGVEHNFIYHRGAIESTLRTLGYSPRPMVESHLIVSAELKDQDYTGIGVSCGAGMFNVGISYKGLPVLSFSTMRGGDWIDESVSAAVGIPAEEVCRIKEGGMDLKSPKGRLEGAIAIYYRNLLHYTLEVMKQKMGLTNHMPTFGRPIPVVCAGGAALIPGFLEVFREEVEKASLPIRIDFIRMAKDPLRAVAMGCLQAAAEEHLAQGEDSSPSPALLERAAVSGTPMKGLPSLARFRQSKVA